eukprot:CAMPEP_0180775694 /NCGR_PEP_ID=MMETSP1038_2-20121128/44409_1 /TAXON_ID=632150 /ORGANISM="Azadinium spinosum, Strain 3D9" /LENGTH=116 /DNA_ID=CAMNT_0022810777 /DNA_START=258 /DNA_END=609 /DNA_ORIENTATION=-
MSRASFIEEQLCALSSLASLQASILLPKAPGSNVISSSVCSTTWTSPTSWVSSTAQATDVATARSPAFASLSAEGAARNGPSMAPKGCLPEASCSDPEQGWLVGAAGATFAIGNSA